MPQDRQTRETKTPSASIEKKHHQTEDQRKTQLHLKHVYVCIYQVKTFLFVTDPRSLILEINWFLIGS